jgi:hypothetical protein
MYFVHKDATLSQAGQWLAQQRRCNVVCPVQLSLRRSASSKDTPGSNNVHFKDDLHHAFDDEEGNQDVTHNAVTQEVPREDDPQVDEVSAFCQMND